MIKEGNAKMRQLLKRAQEPLVKGKKSAYQHPMEPTGLQLTANESSRKMSAMQRLIEETRKYGDRVSRRYEFEDAVGLQ